jgi:hypothetical protein
MTRGPSAPVKLRRLFFIFLAITLFLNAGSVVVLIWTQDMTLKLDKGVQPVLYCAGEFVSVALEARLDLYRYLSDYSGAEEFKAAVVRMQGGAEELTALKENAVAIVPAAEFDALGGEVRKLAKLYDLLIATRASERFSEQNLLERQVEDASLQVLAQAQGMRDRLKIAVARESERLRSILFAMRFVFIASLAASLVIAGGMYLVWQKFEASILGI